jgi:hypothetical protein
MTNKTLRDKFQAATGHAKKAVKLFAAVAEKVVISLAADFARAVLKQHTGLSLATAGLNLMAADTRHGLTSQNRKDLTAVRKSGEKGAAYAKKYEAAAGKAAPVRKAGFAPA